MTNIKKTLEQLPYWQNLIISGHFELWLKEGRFIKRSVEEDNVDDVITDVTLPVQLEVKKVHLTRPLPAPRSEAIVYCKPI